jgi:hypothetical protein
VSDTVFFGWDPAAPGSEKTTCRCTRCKCLHVWTVAEHYPRKCTSCGALFNFANLQIVK